MKFDVLTLFPEMFEPVKQSILGRAEENKLIEVNLINIRDFSENKHKKVDDTPYGGGAGMVMQADVIYNAYKSIKKTNAKVIYMSPQGQVLNQKKVEGLSKEEHLIILCGHYEGVDQRILDKIVDEEISIGNYVLTGGLPPHSSHIVLLRVLSLCLCPTLFKRSGPSSVGLCASFRQLPPSGCLSALCRRTFPSVSLSVTSS